MKEFRNLLQSKLNEIEDLESTPELDNEVLEKGVNYFSYSLAKNYVNSDTDRNYTYDMSLIGYIERIRVEEEDTILILDEIQSKIESKLKELNFKLSFDDVSIADGIKKIRVVGNVKFNEINKGLI